MAVSKHCLPLLVAVSATALVSLASPAEAASWVRGRGSVNSNAVVDPLNFAPNGSPLTPTISTGMFNDAQKGFRSVADLGNGALRGRAYVSGGAGSSFANPEMGETVTFRNETTETTNWDFSYDVDGVIRNTGMDLPLQQTFPGVGTFTTTTVQYALHIFAGNTVTYSNVGTGPASPAPWNNRTDQALFSVVKNVDNFPSSGVLADGTDLELFDNISGSLPLAPGLNSFDVVLVLNLLISVPQGVVTDVEFDFMNTARLTVDSPAPFTSNSTVFLTGANIVPEPGAIAALAPVACLGLARRRR